MTGRGRPRSAAWLAVALAAALALGGGVAGAKPSGEPEVAEVVLRLQKRYDATRDFTADFRQEVEVPTLGKTLSSTGRVFFKRPGKMRWEFQDPERQTIVADGSTLWVYQPEHKQVMKTAFEAAFRSGTPLSFLLGVGKLAKDFTPSLAESKDADVVRLRLVPKEDAAIGVLVLELGAESYDIVGAEVTDPLGNVTRLRFDKIRRGVGLADSLFEFDPPPGTDVVTPAG